MFINNGFYMQYYVVCSQHNSELGQGNTALLIHPRNPKDHCKDAFQINPVLGKILQDGFGVGELPVFLFYS